MRGYSIPEAEKQALRDAWAAAVYRVDVPNAPTHLHLGERATALESCLPARSYCVITAFNPPPGDAGPRANQAANRRLARLIAAHRWPATPVEASDRHGHWREPGWLLRDIGPRQAHALGRRFG